MADELCKQILLWLMLLIILVMATNDAVSGHVSRLDNAGDPDSRRHLVVNNYQDRRKRTQNKTRSAKHNNEKYKLHGNNTLIRAQASTTVILHCNMSNMSLPIVNTTVTWSKKSNGSIIQLARLESLLIYDPAGYATKQDDPSMVWVRNEKGRIFSLVQHETVVTNDKRFYGSYDDNKKDWSLHIRYTQRADEGVYQCQIHSNLTAVIYVTLKLVDAHAKIIGGPEKYIPSDRDSPLRLSCVLINSIVGPEYIFWYHADRMINYDLGDGATVREGRMGSELIFPKANKTHAGNYSCVPSNARPASVKVNYGEIHIREDYGDEQNGGGGCGIKPRPLRDHIVNMLLLITTFHLHR